MKRSGSGGRLPVSLDVSLLSNPVFPGKTVEELQHRHISGGVTVRRVYNADAGVAWHTVNALSEKNNAFQF